MKLAYVAGIVDGEGCITIPSNGSRNSFCARLTVAGTSKVLISRLCAELGGVIYQMSPKSQVNKPVWAWQLTGVTVPCLLRRLLPQLIVKKAEALVVLGVPRLAQRTQSRWTFRESAQVRRARARLSALKRK